MASNMKAFWQQKEKQLQTTQQQQQQQQQFQPTQQTTQHLQKTQQQSQIQPTIQTTKQFQQFQQTIAELQQKHHTTQPTQPSQQFQKTQQSSPPPSPPQQQQRIQPTNQKEGNNTIPKNTTKSNNSTQNNHINNNLTQKNATNNNGDNDEITYIKQPLDSPSPPTLESASGSTSSSPSPSPYISGLGSSSPSFTSTHTHRFVRAPHARYSLPYPTPSYPPKRHRLSGSFPSKTSPLRDLPSRRFSSALVDRMKVFEYPEVIEKISPNSSPSLNHRPNSQVPTHSGGPNSNGPNSQIPNSVSVVPPKRPPPPPPRRKPSDPTPVVTNAITPTPSLHMRKPSDTIARIMEQLPTSLQRDPAPPRRKLITPVSNARSPSPVATSSSPLRLSSPSSNDPPPKLAGPSPLKLPNSTSSPLPFHQRGLVLPVNPASGISPTSSPSSYKFRPIPPPKISSLVIPPPPPPPPPPIAASSKSLSPSPAKPSPPPSKFFRDPPAVSPLLRGRAHTVATSSGQPSPLNPFSYINSAPFSLSPSIPKNPDDTSAAPRTLRNRNHTVSIPSNTSFPPTTSDTPSDPSLSERLSLGSERPLLSRRNAKLFLSDVSDANGSDGNSAENSSTTSHNSNNKTEKKNKPSGSFNAQISSTFKQISFNSPRSWFVRGLSSSGHSSNNELEITLSSSNSSPRPISPFSLASLNLAVTRQHRKSIPQLPDLGHAYKVIREMLETEADYVDDLEVILQLYMETIRRCHMLPDETVGLIFGNVKEIQEVSLALLNELKDIVQQHINTNTSSETDPPPPPPPVASLFFKMVAPPCPFSRYMPYLQAHERAIQIVNAAMESNAEFAAVLQECRQHVEAKNLDLNSYLIKPIQRVCKYPLLLKELHKSLTALSHPETNSEVSVCLVAAAGIGSLVGRINAEIDHMQKMNGIKAVLEGANNNSKNVVIIKDLDKLLAGRKLLREGRLWRVKKRTSQQHMGTYFLLDTILLGVEDKKLHGRQIKTYVRLVNISSVCVMGGNSIQITYTSEEGKPVVLVVATESYLDKLLWLQDVEMLVKEFSPLYEKHNT